MGKYTVLKEIEEWSLGGSFDSRSKKEFNTYEEAQKYLKEDFFKTLESSKKYIEKSFSGSGYKYKDLNYKDDEEEGYVVYYEGKSAFAYISEYYLEEDLDEAKIVHHSCNDNTSVTWTIVGEEVEEENKNINDKNLYCKHCGKKLEQIYSKQICNRYCDYYLEEGYDNIRYEFDEDNIDVTEHLGYYCNECDNKIDEEQEKELTEKYNL